MLIGDLMTDSGVQFGTSGARGRVADMTDAVCYAYTRGFLQHLAESGQTRPGAPVAIAGDLRPSTPRIMNACAAAVADLGARVINCGFVPSPAVAAYGLARGIPSIMVTGSHIPDDRNGIKFNGPTGEILKEDEAAIRCQPVVSLSEVLAPAALPPAEAGAASAYVSRYLAFFPVGALAGCRVGLYEHSSVARELLHEVRQISQEEMAARFGRTQSAISQIEKRGDLLLSTLTQYIETTDGERMNFTVQFPESKVQVVPF